MQTSVIQIWSSQVCFYSWKDRFTVYKSLFNSLTWGLLKMNDKQSESNNHHDFTTCSASISHVAYATISQLSDYDLLVAHLIFMLSVASQLAAA